MTFHIQDWEISQRLAYCPLVQFICFIKCQPQLAKHYLTSRIELQPNNNVEVHVKCSQDLTMCTRIRNTTHSNFMKTILRIWTHHEKRCHHSFDASGWRGHLLLKWSSGTDHKSAKMKEIKSETNLIPNIICLKSFHQRGNLGNTGIFLIDSSMKSIKK